MFQINYDQRKVRISAIFVNIIEVINANNKNIPHKMPHVKAITVFVKPPRQESTVIKNRLLIRLHVAVVLHHLDLTPLAKIHHFLTYILLFSV
jgi:hypothetical protein